MESSEFILLFLKKMRLEKHHSKIISNSLFKISTIQDFQLLLTNVNYLEEIGLTSAEINRFKRLFEKTLKVSNHVGNFVGKTVFGIYIVDSLSINLIFEIYI